jgi:hypothetical protein
MAISALASRSAVESDPDADAGEQIVAVDLKRRPQRVEDPAGDQRRLGWIADLLQQHRELVPAESRHRVPRSHGGGQPGRQRDQELVADGVAEAVVDQLEAVDVHEQHGAGGARVAREPLQRLLHAVHEQRPVGQAGEAVVQGIVLQVQLGHSAIGDVGHRTGHPLRAAVVAPRGQPADQHPAPAAVGVANAVLGAQLG